MQSSAVEVHDPFSDDAQRSNNPTARNNRPTLERLHTSRVPAFAPLQASSTTATAPANSSNPTPPSPVSQTGRHHTGPSHINWLSSTAPHTPSPLSTNAPRWPTPSSGSHGGIPSTPYAHHLGHSASSPSLLPAVAGASSSISIPTSVPVSGLGPAQSTNRMYKHPSLTSNRSLQLDMMYSHDNDGTQARDAEWDDSDRGSQTQTNKKQLSPILERTWYPALRREQKSLARGGSPPTTPGTTASFDPGWTSSVLAPVTSFSHQF